MGYKGILTIEPDVNGKIVVTENLTFTHTIGISDPKIEAVKAAWAQLLAIIAKLK